jgi:hypothetical protein
MSTITAGSTLTDFARAAVALADAGFTSTEIATMLGHTTAPTMPAKAPAKAVKPTVVKATKVAQTTPKAKTVKKADKSLVKTKIGRMMPSAPGTVTDSQVAKLVDLCNSIGDPLTAKEISNVKTWSMAKASDYRYDIING